MNEQDLTHTENEQIVETENIINELEKLKKKFYIAKKNNQKNIKKNNINNILTIISSILSIFIWGGLANKIDFTVNTIKFGHFFTLWCSIISLTVIFFSSTINQYQNNKINDEINGLNLSLKNLEKELKTKKQYLVTLKTNITEESKKNAFHIKELSELKKLLL